MTAAIYRLLKQLDDAGLHYNLQRHRPDTIDVTITIVGKRIEVAVFDDDHMEVSQFLGNEDVEDEDYLQNILSGEIEYDQIARDGSTTIEPKNADGNDQ